MPQMPILQMIATRIPSRANLKVNTISSFRAEEEEEEPSLSVLSWEEELLPLDVLLPLLLLIMSGIESEKGKFHIFGKKPFILATDYSSFVLICAIPYKSSAALLSYT